MDIVETPEKICYHFELIGIADKEDIDLTIDFDMLRIDCKKPQVRKKC
jgi:HSP20 family molecular chaperone IbpA